MAKKQKSQERSPIGITTVEYGRLQVAYDHFNKTLFEGRLPDLFITYQRHAHSRGYFSPDRFSPRWGTLGQHELALNPDAFIDRTDEQIASTLLHEMVHVEQHVFGKPGARGYHNKQWAARMKALGLQPSSTGAVGGKETGQHMSHYILPGGPFSQSYDQLAATGWILNLQSAPRPGGTRAPNSKVKSTCPECGGNAWSKPNYQLACVACDNVLMVPEKAEIQSYDAAA
jgi:hypothetical protein